MDPTPDNSAFTRVDKPSVDIATADRFLQGFLALCESCGLMAANAVCHLGGGAFEVTYGRPDMVAAIESICDAGMGKAPAPEIAPLLLCAIQHMAEVFPELHAGHARTSLLLAEAIRRVLPGAKPPVTVSATCQRN